jgi:hypothetical protein
VTTFSDLLSSLKDELAARYKSPIWGTALIVLAVYHWKIIIFFLTEKPTAKDAIEFIETNCSSASIISALAIALCYVILFPWVELIIARISSSGKRARNNFLTEEREREIGRRKVIAQEQANLIEIELKNKFEQSKIADTELARNLQNIIQGENLTRWLNDLQKGPINTYLQNTISNYLSKADSIEGKFINPEIQSAHAKFISDLSTLNSALTDLKAGDSNSQIEAKRAELIKFSTEAQTSQQEYRKKVRELLEF